MKDYIKRFLIAGIMALCISLLFLGGKNAKAESVSSIESLTSDWIWPSNGVITDTFGTREGHHKGIDIADEFGSSVYVVDNGIVTKSYFSSSYGNVVFIKHENNMETVYAHLKERNVTEGQKVKQGQVIGKMGSTGQSSGVHLHFEIHLSEWTYEKENAIDPVIALGNAEVGQVVQAINKDKENTVVEVSAKWREPNNESKDKRSVNYKPASKEEDSKKDIIHKVKKGETLWSIAKSYKTSVSSIQKSNNITNNLIKTGQELVVHTYKD